MEALQQQLESAGVDISGWGTGQAKTVEHLLAEIEAGETVLVTGQDGKLVRKVIVSAAEVYYQDSHNGRLRLKEAKQIFNDGRQRIRDSEGSVAEKVKMKENPRQAIVRGIKEELGLTGEINLSAIGVYEHTQESPSYPGLLSQYIVHKFKVGLNPEQFNPDGYTEEQNDMTTYFVWERAEQSPSGN